MMTEPVTNPEYGRHRGYRSLFWPIVLIGIGVIWLLANLNVVQISALGVMFRFWPVLLILIGLDIIFSRMHFLVGAVLGLITVGLVIVALLVGSTIKTDGPTTLFGVPINLDAGGQVKSEQFRAPLENTRSAAVRIDLNRWQTTVSAAADPEMLAEADVDYTGEFTFMVTGSDNKSVTIGQPGINVTSWYPGSLAADYHWHIGLNNTIPLALTVDTGSGSNIFDLGSLQLSRIDFNGGSGRSELNLPATADRLPVDITSHSGSFSVTMPDHTIADVHMDAASGAVAFAVGTQSDVRLRWKGGSGSQTLAFGNDVLLDASLDTSSGSLTIDLPDNAAVRIEVLDAGSGSISLPEWIARQSGEGKEGVWESADYGSASSRITLRLTTGSGSVTIH